jgi:hypothetical protein
VKLDRFRGLVMATVLLMACCALAPSTARSEVCPAPNRLERLGVPEAGQFWMALCIPPGNDQYRVNEGRLVDLFWRGDIEIPQPDGYDPAQLGVDPDLTVATVWHNDQSEEGAISGPMMASILRAAEAKGANGTFEAKVPFNGHVFPVQFERLDGGLLKGAYSASRLGNTSEVKTLTFVLRPIGVTGRPHLAMCGTRKALHMCTVFANAADREVMMMVASDTLDRSFRLSEEIAGKLNAFAISAP